MKKQVTILLALLPLYTLSFAQEHARILDYYTKYSIKNERIVQLEKRYSILILSDKAKIHETYLDYFDSFKTIKKLEIIVKDQYGKKIRRLTKNNGHVVGANPYYQISDSKYLILDPEYKNYPYTLEITSITEWKGFVSLPQWMPRSQFNLAVDKAILEIESNPEVALRIREKNISLHAEKRNSDGWPVKTYTVKNLPHVNKNIRYKDFYQQQARVSLYPQKFNLDDISGSAESWAEFGEWFLKLNSEAYTLKDDTKKFIDNLDKTDKRKLINDIFFNMQDRTRYVSIQLGIGGFKSMATEEVEAKGFGDCKALSTYMKNLLDYAGIESNYVLVYAGEDVPDVEVDFPGNQFNHVFLGIPINNDTIYLECTSQVTPPNYIANFTDDRNVLWISKGSSTIIRSPVYSHLENVQRNRALVEISEDGTASIQLTTQNKGSFFYDIFMYKGAPEFYIQNENIKKFHFKDFAIKDFTYDQKSREKDHYSSSFSLEVKNLATPVNERLILPVDVFSPITSYLDYDEFMNYADITRGFTIQDEFDVALKENYWIQKVPEALEISTPFGQYKIHFSIDQNTLSIKREIQMYKGSYQKSDFAAFKEFINTIKKAETQRMVLNSKT